MRPPTEGCGLSKGSVAALPITSKNAIEVGVDAGLGALLGAQRLLAGAEGLGDGDALALAQRQKLLAGGVVPAGEALLGVLGHGHLLAVAGAGGGYDARVDDVRVVHQKLAHARIHGAIGLKDGVGVAALGRAVQVRVGDVDAAVGQHAGDVGEHPAHIALVHDHARAFAGDVHVDAVDAPDDRRAAPDGDAPHLQGAPLAALAADVHGVGVRHLGGRVPDDVHLHAGGLRQGEGVGHARVVGRKAPGCRPPAPCRCRGRSRWRRRSRTG